MSAIISALQTELDQAVYALWVSRLCQVAGTTLVLWDHFITLDLEFLYIWKSFSVATVLYVIIRYLGDAAAIIGVIALLLPPSNETVSRGIQNALGWIPLIILLCTQIVLQARIYALCRRSKRILAFMLVLFLAEAIALFVLIGGAVRSIEVVSIPFVNIKTCLASQADRPSQIVWVIILCFEGILFILVLWIGISHGYTGLRRDFFGRSVFKSLIRGNVFYFACVMVACITDEAVSRILGEEWILIPSAISDTMEVIVGCRLILNLHASLLRDTLSED
ncbi:hypothetical protein F5I97DRAFT_57671 [Phlebopus sp. FC_14]|nr:hypothetical protein F5I97DRAFT_57671 [Phlebopus sp. FC_14]